MPTRLPHRSFSGPPIPLDREIDPVPPAPPLRRHQWEFNIVHYTLTTVSPLRPQIVIWPPPPDLTSPTIVFFFFIQFQLWFIFLSKRGQDPTVRNRRAVTRRATLRRAGSVSKGEMGSDERKEVPAARYPWRRKTQKLD